jgi:hypothetical protein
MHELVGYMEQRAERCSKKSKGSGCKGLYLPQGRQRPVESNRIRKAGGSRGVDLVKRKANRDPKTSQTPRGRGEWGWILNEPQRENAIGVSRIRNIAREKVECDVEMESF